MIFFTCTDYHWSRLVYMSPVIKPLSITSYIHASPSAGDVKAGFSGLGVLMFPWNVILSAILDQI